MAKRVTPLFAVMALGLGVSAASAKPERTTPRTLPSGAPACGNAQTKSPRPCTTAVATVPAAKPEPKPTQATPFELMRKTLVLLGLRTEEKAEPVTPRRLRNGSPANGNVQGRMARREEDDGPRRVEQPRETHHD